MERRKFTREFKLEAVRLIKERGVSYAQASHDLSVHQSQLRSWVKALGDDPQHAFPGHGQMKPEQLETSGVTSALFVSHRITKRFARKSIKRGQQAIAPSPDRIVLEQQRKRAYASCPLETAEHGIIGVGRHLATE